MKGKDFGQKSSIPLKRITYLHFSWVRKSIRQSLLKAMRKESKVCKSQMTALNHREKQWGMEEQNRPHGARVSVAGKQRSSSIFILLVLGRVN